MQEWPDEGMSPLLGSHFSWLVDWLLFLILSSGHCGELFF